MASLCASRRLSDGSDQCLFISSSQVQRLLVAVGAGTCVMLAAFSDAEVEDILTRKAATGNCLMQASRELTRLQFNADVPGGWIFFLFLS